ncbi:MAG TPA: transcriptional repressor LexA [Candidatus Faecivivens stercorigallinarum]|nr:transcriptional repressor LexA [Candidatus Faecivivens stercorigallinarum]
MDMQNNRALEIYNYIRDCIQNRNFSPTVREICEEVGIKSTSTVHYYLQMLEEKGYIVKDPLKKRTIKLPGSTSKAIPLLGTVTAGIPITAIQEVEEYIPVNNLSGSAEDYFALHVRGTSMIGAGIMDGDIAIVRRTPVADNGDIIVAMIDDEATVKRFYRESDHVRLQPENPAFEPILTTEVVILGKVVMLMRNYE